MNNPLKREKIIILSRGTLRTVKICENVITSGYFWRFNQDTPDQAWVAAGRPSVDGRAAGVGTRLGRQPAIAGRLSGCPDGHPAAWPPARQSARPPARNPGLS